MRYRKSHCGIQAPGFRNADSLVRGRAFHALGIADQVKRGVKVVPTLKPSPARFDLPITSKSFTLHRVILQPSHVAEPQIPQPTSKPMKMKSFFMFLIALGIGGSGYCAREGQLLINRAMQVEPNTQLRIPEEIESALQIAILFGHVEAINLFPFGKGQSSYIRQLKIKRVTINLRQESPDGAISPNINKSFAIDFFESGLVRAVSHFQNNNKVQITEYEYISERPKSIKTTVFSSTWGVSGISAEVAIENNINSTITRFSPAGNTVHSLSSFDKRWRAINISPGFAFMGEHRFAYSPEGELQKITEIGRLASSDGPITTATLAISYDGIFPKSSSRESISGDNPWYYKYNPAPFTFQSTEGRLSQVRQMKNFETGQVYQNREISYSWSDNRIDSLETVIDSSRESWVVNFNDDFDVSAIRSKARGFSITESKGRITELFFGDLYRNYKSDWGPVGVIIFKYNTKDDIPYRLSITESTGKYSATIDAQQTVYFD
ncbi:hypothetical protein LNV09_00505 [Paucibacter sp. B2R-40]|nr:hypothetical protein [Paucibacter sp. B2R-40]